MWYRMKGFVHFKIQRPIVAVFLLLCLTSSPCSAAAPSWRSLTPNQREALAPMVGQWDILPEIQRNRLLKTAKYYPKMTPEQKQRYHDRLEKWSKLTPEQREAARKRFRAFKKLPANERERICLLYTSPSPRDRQKSRMPSSA